MVLPDNFIKSLKERKVIPFIGAGVSKNVRDKEGNQLFPDWKELLLASSEKLRNNDKESEAKIIEGNLGLSSPNYLEAAKAAQKHLGSELYQLIKEKIGISYKVVNQSSLEIPKMIWEISNNLVITTNYDKVLSWICPIKEDLSQWNIEATKEQADLIRTQSVSQPVVWHLHGHIDDVRNIILTPDGYERLYPSETNLETKYKAALKTLQTLFVSNTFLFIGFSLDDEYFVNQLRYVQQLFQDTTEKHYVLIRETEKAKFDSLDLGIEPITFESYGEKMLEKLREIKKKSEEFADSHGSEIKPEKTATERFNPGNRVVHIPFNRKGDQVVGRDDDLKEVRETLSKGTPTNIGQAVAFRGLGGLGKTQLAVEYAYEFQDKYLNGVIWLTVDQDIDKQLVEICDKAEWVAPISEISVKLDVAKNRLKKITDCLIILDNVETFDETIKNYLPSPCKDIHILATSRYELIGFNPISLNLLNLEQSVQMLKQESRRKIKDKNELKIAEEIAEELGMLPLALELAGGFLRYRESFSWENYLSLLKENSREAFKEKFLQGNFTEHDTDVYRTLKVNEELFESEPLLLEALNLLTWSGTAAMGVELMCHLLGKNEIELLEALSLGESLKLLQKSKERNGFAIHRLVGEVRKEDIPLAEKIDWAENICQLLGDWFQEIKDDFTKLSQYEADLEHLLQWQKHAEQFEIEDASRLLWLQAYPPFYRAEYEEAKEIVDQALNVYKNQAHENQEVLANLYNDLGSLFGELGKYQKQIEFQSIALNIRLELFGEKHTDTAGSYNNVGYAYGNLGKYQKKLEFQSKALNIHLELFGEEHTDTALYYNNVGEAYGNLGIYQKQLELVDKAFDIQLELFGEKHPDTARSFNNVGAAYGDLGKYQKQLEFQSKALEINLELFGEEHPFTATSYNNVGRAYGDLEDYDSAIEFGKKALKIRVKILGKDHPHTLTTVRNLIGFFVYNPRKDKALEMKTEALELVNEYLQAVPNSSNEYLKLQEDKEWILREFQKKGFSSKKKKRRKKKRK